MKGELCALFESTVISMHLVIPWNNKRETYEKDTLTLW